MDGRTKAEQPLPRYPEKFHTLCEGKTESWPRGWEVEFGSTNYFYLIGFDEYIYDKHKMLNVNRLKGLLDSVIEEARSNIPNSWLGISVADEADPAVLNELRKARLDDLGPGKFGRPRVERLRDGKSVSFNTALLAIACVRELMAADLSETRSLEDVFEIRWAGYIVHPWFSVVHEKMTEKHMNILCGFTMHHADRSVFREIASGYPITRPLAKRIQMFVREMQKEGEFEEQDLTIVTITSRLSPSRRLQRRMEMRPAKDEKVIAEWPSSDTVLSQSAK
ncbi:hypothetical protein [Sulfitobacter pacificus]|uniref:hypothetical protein n=1 Tax=Sulfitobacter pacificus TaxID=1499314 RepID=UPI003106DCBD